MFPPILWYLLIFLGIFQISSYTHFADASSIMLAFSQNYLCSAVITPSFRNILLVPWSSRSCIDIIATTSLRFLRKRRTKLPVLEFSFTMYSKSLQSFEHFLAIYISVSFFPMSRSFLKDDPVRVAGTNELTDAWGLPVHQFTPHIYYIKVQQDNMGRSTSKSCYQEYCIP